MMNKTISAQQLAVGMNIRCPIEGDIITITDLVAISEQLIGLGCSKGYTSIDVDMTIELLEPFDLSTVNTNWIKEQLIQDEEGVVAYELWERNYMMKEE
ncbi:hypothetical protein [Shewanella colwelliana]|uniref:hypothetical protein n=1 Tax=Shewanella colwelliana TaxID=23 RepID=UPI003734DE84